MDKTGDGDFKNDGTRVSEVWNGRNWEVYQEISGLPQGSYKIPCKGSIPRVPEMITHGMKVGGRKATRRVISMATFSVTMLLNPFSMLQLVRRRRTWLKTVRK